jgi:hypothetical protein
MMSAERFPPDTPTGLRLANAERRLGVWARRCRGGYHARSLTDGVPVRSMKQLFELALQLEPPWRVVSSDFDFARRRVELRLGFRTGARFPCPQCGRACNAVEFTEGTWRQPDVMAFEAFVTVRLPSIRCPEHGDVALAPSWASDHMSLRGMIRDRTTDQLGGTSADPSSRDAVHPGAPGRPAGDLVANRSTSVFAGDRGMSPTEPSRNR